MHEGHRKRLRSRYLREGLDSFAPHEVLELLLTYAIPRIDVNPLAHELIRHYGSLSAVLETSAQELQRFPQVGENAAVLLSMLPKLSGYYMRDRFRDRPLLSTSAKAGEYCMTLFQGLGYEAIYMLCLDARSRLIHPALLQTGTIDESIVYTRQVLEVALRYDAFAVVLTHNHPGGGLSPSIADYQMTRAVSEALAMMQVRTIDHIIVAEGQYLSMARHSLKQPGELIEGKDFLDRVKSIALSDDPPRAMQESLHLEGYDGFQPEE